MGLLYLTAVTLAASNATAPSSALSPKQVVEAQMSALSDNDRPKKDSGIAIAFRFASPDNKRVTGPLRRFITIVRSAAYAPMIDNRSVVYGDASIEGRRAAVPILVTAKDGRRYGYVFLLEQQPSGEFSNCWMTAGVELIGEAPEKEGISL